MTNLTLTYTPEVQMALATNKPIVALESTLITHGFPPPHNLTVARAIEATVRDAGATPATIAILGGEIMVGLTEAQLTSLAQNTTARKCSVRDLPIVLAQKGDGATTVAATMVIAHRAGIQVFATGGIGGVHRGGGRDVSADLTELGRTPITVICAGMKAFLDLPDTVEYLETLAVPVVGYQTAVFPTFYSRTSDLGVDVTVQTPQEVAELIATRDALNLSNALLVAVPVPAEAAWPADKAQPVIETALTDAERANVKGKDITPFVLERIAQHSAGKSMAANIALLTNNAKVGAYIAAALALETK